MRLTRGEGLLYLGGMKIIRELVELLKKVVRGPELVFIPVEAE